jgi:hypothetical protein
MNCRTVAKHAFIILTVVTLAACRTDYEETESESATVNVEITTPSAFSSIDTTDDTVSIAGTASADLGIAKVTWVNDRGGKGTANGAEQWQTGNIALELGDNTVTVTAEDTTGAKTERHIVVKRESRQKGSASLSWTAPTTRVDGSPLTNLAGYKILYGRMSGIYDYETVIDNPGVVAYVVEDLVPGDWYFTVDAYDSDGLESDLSNEVHRTIK